MELISGNIWDYFVESEKTSGVAIPTNKVVMSGRLVMGAGLALQAKLRYPESSIDFASQDFSAVDSGKYLLHIPTKNHYKDPSSLILLDAACQKILRLIEELKLDICFIPLLGAGLGGLNPGIVREILRLSFANNDRIKLVEYV